MIGHLATNGDTHPGLKHTCDLCQNTTRRGYGSSHQRRRKALKADVDAGRTNCSRCGQPIRPGEPWDLDHTPDRRTYLGPSHARCNRAGFLKGDSGMTPPSFREKHAEGRVESAEESWEGPSIG